jgi:hypothetical protein
MLARLGLQKPALRVAGRSYFRSLAIECKMKKPGWPVGNIAFKVIRRNCCIGMIPGYLPENLPYSIS